jgi:hypothetical protein
MAVSYPHAKCQRLFHIPPCAPGIINCFARGIGWLPYAVSEPRITRTTVGTGSVPTNPDAPEHDTEARLLPKPVPNLRVGTRVASYLKSDCMLGDRDRRSLGVPSPIRAAVPIYTTASPNVDIVLSTEPVWLGPPEEGAAGTATLTLRFLPSPRLQVAGEYGTGAIELVDRVQASNETTLTFTDRSVTAEVLLTSYTFCEPMPISATVLPGDGESRKSSGT